MFTNWRVRSEEALHGSSGIEYKISAPRTAAYHKLEIYQRDNINYYPFERAHAIDETHVNRRMGAMQPYAEN